MPDPRYARAPRASDRFPRCDAGLLDAMAAFHISRPTRARVWEKLRQTLAMGCALAFVASSPGCRSDNSAATSPRTEVETPRETRSPIERPAVGPSSASEGPPEALAAIPTRHGDAPRIVAIGDLHGDLAATRSVLRLVGAIDDADRWIGGSLVVVQTGDQLDRGDDERAILDLLARLRDEARAAGGALHVLNGNHEIMNAAGDLRYVTPGGFADFAQVEGLHLDDPRLAQLPAMARPRAAAFTPGGPYARELARRNVVVLVGDTVFVHGGVLPEHVSWCGGRDVACLERVNEDVRRWLHGSHDDPQGVIQTIMAPDSLVWTRAYSDATTAEGCRMLDQTLEALSAVRMVVGHTVQKDGITSACDDKVWRVDVGLAAAYGGQTPQALEIAGDRVRVLKADRAQ
jgi:hypothetical protein